MTADGLFFFIAGIISVVTILIILHQRKTMYLYRLCGGILLVIISVITYLYGTAFKEAPSIDSALSEISGTDCDITAVVENIIEKDTYTQLYLKKSQITLYKNKEKNSNETENTESAEIRADKEVKLLANANKCNVYIGDTVNINGQIKKFDISHNEGEFNSRKYYASIGIMYKVSISDIKVVSQNNSQLINDICEFRKKLKQVYESVADSCDAGIYISMVLGDKSSLDEEVKLMYQKNGIAHLLAISGLHISLIGMLIYKMLRKAGLSYLVASFTGVVLVVCYGIMTGNSVSTIRAVIMLAIALGAEILGRTYDMLSALSLAAIILIYDNPLVIENSAFQLSFGALIGISVVYKELNELIRGLAKKYKNKLEKDKEKTIIIKIIQKAGEAVLVSLSVNVATFPVLIWNYYEFPLYSVFLNVLVVPLMSVLMLCAVAAGLSGMISVVAGTFLIGASHYILQFYDVLCTFVQKLPCSIIVTGKPSGGAVAGYYILISVFLIIVRYNKNIINVYKAISISNKTSKLPCNIKIQNVFSEIYVEVLGLVILVIAFIVLLHRPTKGFEINMIDVGQGDCILLNDGDGVMYLFDGGSTDIKQVGKYRIMPMLKSKRVTVIDYVLVSHSDADHINGIEELIDMTGNTFKIKYLVLPQIKDKEIDDSYCKLEQMALEKHIDVIYVNTGSIIKQKNIVDTQEYISVRCVHPKVQYNYKSTNDYSASYMIKYNNFKMLMTGDVEKNGENAMIDTGMLSEVSVLKTAHHGSSSSTSKEFLQKICPKIAIISSGINNKYGHPSKETIENLKNAGTDIYITAESGEITIFSDGNSISVQVEKK